MLCFSAHVYNKYSPGIPVLADNFQWSDGSKVNYKNWAPGEPNNGNNNEDCTEVKYGTPQWNDMPCTSYMYGYVCMTKAGEELCF